jgi:hypothetical protein
VAGCGPCARRGQGRRAFHPNKHHQPHRCRTKRSSKVLEQRLMSVNSITASTPHLSCVHILTASFSLNGDEKPRYSWRRRLSGPLHSLLTSTLQSPRTCANTRQLHHIKAAAPHQGSGIPLGWPCPLLKKPLRRKVNSPRSRRSFPTVTILPHTRRDRGLDHHDASDQAR